MHHADSAGDSPGPRKMAHSSVFSNRRGSNTGGGSLSNTANANINANVIQTDDNQSSLLSQHAPPAACSSPGPHHPPHSLSVQSQALQGTGAQVKKKSGFQITSVLPAQVSASANNSIADDTESYDDMDESHTEDLSSSDMLDVSVSRATDHGVPERSSSEETLNSLHGGETPGVVSPNEPVLHHSLPHGAQQGYMMNGSVHHPGHHHHSHQHHGHHQDLSHPSAAPVPVDSQSTGLPFVPGVAGVVGHTASHPPSGLESGQIVRPIPVRPVPPEGAAAGIAIQPPVSSKGPVSIGHGGALGIVSSGLIGGMQAVGGSTQTGSVATPISATPIPSNPATQSQASVPAATAPSAAITTTATATGSTATSTASRFRVVKLDSNSEPYRKGRWTCTEFYEKEAPPTATSAPPTTTSTTTESAAAVSVPQPAAPESDSTTSGSSSIGSTLGEPGIPPGQPVYGSLPGIPMQQQQQSLPPHPGLPSHGTQPQAIAQDGSVVPPIHPGSLPPSSHPAAGLQTMPHAVGMPATEAQASMRPQQAMAYPMETQPGQGQIYPATHQPPPPTAPSTGITHGGMQAQDFAQHSQGMQPANPGHTMAPMQVGDVPVGGPAGTTAGGMPAPQGTQSRPAVAHTQAPGGQGAQQQPQQSLQHPSTLIPDHQAPQGQHAGPLPTSSAAVAAATAAIAAAAAAGVLPGQSTMTHPALNLAHAGAALPASMVGLGLTPQGLVPQGGGTYGGSSSLTASQLEDAQRLLFQQSLPRLAAAAVAGVGVEGTISTEPGALAATAGAEGDSSSGASVVAIDNKIEQAMDLVKSHLMYAVREEVEVLKEQIKELVERNSQLEQENNLLKNLASPEQLAQFQSQVQPSSPTAVNQPGMLGGAAPQAPAQSLPPPNQGTGPSA